MKFDNTLLTFVMKDLEKGLIPMLLGEPGIGKSSWIENLANLKRTTCFVLACNQLADKADLTGARLVPADNGEYKQMFYPHATILDAIQYAEENPRENPILFLDELNRTTPDVTSELLSIPTLRSIGSRQLPDNLSVIIAGNDKGNVTSLDEASVSRFVLYKVEPDTNTFLGLDQNLNPFVKNVLQAHPEVIFCKTISMSLNTDDDDDEADDLYIEDILDDVEDMNQFTTPRTISGISRWLNGFTNQELAEFLANTYVQDGEETNALQEAIEGHVGRTSFSAYLMAEIASGIMSVNNQAGITTVAKPACYDKMKSSTDVQALNELIEDMSDNERSGCLLYSLYEKEDNTVYINALSSHVDKLIPNDMKSLMKLASTDDLDIGNTNSLLNTNSEISNTLSIILEAN